MMMTYNIAEQFSTTPGGRFRKHGRYSEEEFREEVLRGLFEKAIGSDDKLAIILDGTAGYGSSFLEEAFGGLIRLGLFEREQVERHLELRALDPLCETYRLSADRHMKNARPRH